MDELSADSFRQCLEQDFEMPAVDEEGNQMTIAAQLIEVKSLKSDTKREDKSPFSLLFRGPSQANFEQGVFAMRNETMGDLQIFLVNLGPDPDAEGMLFEAVFT